MIDVEQKSVAEVALQRKVDNQVLQRVEMAATRAKHRACFWTWPFGHIWGEAGSSSMSRACVCCGASSIRGIHDGEWKYDLTKK
jgi:hypothetical protein